MQSQFFSILTLLSLMIFSTGCTKKAPVLPPEIDNPAMANLNVRVRWEKLATENLDGFAAKRDRSKFILSHFYVNIPSPYAAPISNEVRCPQKFHPLFFDSDSPTSLQFGAQLYAGERDEYGVCDEARARSLSLMTLIYCKNKKIGYEIKVFADPKSTPDLQALFAGFVCRT